MRNQEKRYFSISGNPEKQMIPPALFKKLSPSIWEYRTRYKSKQYRLFAFWDKSEPESTLVIATHGFVKKTQKIPKQEVERAEQLKNEYFENK